MNNYIKRIGAAEYCRQPELAPKEIKSGMTNVKKEVEKNETPSQFFPSNPLITQLLIYGNYLLVWFFE